MRVKVTSDGCRDLRPFAVATSSYPHLYDSSRHRGKRNVQIKPEPSELVPLRLRFVDWLIIGVLKRWSYDEKTAPINWRRKKTFSRTHTRFVTQEGVDFFLVAGTGRSCVCQGKNCQEGWGLNPPSSCPDSPNSPFAMYPCRELAWTRKLTYKDALSNCAWYK